ncbi:unnamed protein product [Scytosiphon promiscuus]
MGIRGVERQLWIWNIGGLKSATLRVLRWLVAVSIIAQVGQRGKGNARGGSLRIHCGNGWWLLLEVVPSGRESALFRFFLCSIAFFFHVMTCPELVGMRLANLDDRCSSYLVQLGEVRGRE